jgi:hypothetical protein
MVETKVVKEPLGGFVGFRDNQPRPGAVRPRLRMHQLRECKPGCRPMQSGQAGACSVLSQRGRDRRTAGNRW